MAQQADVAYPDVGAWQRTVTGSQAADKAYPDVGAWQRQVGAAVTDIFPDWLLQKVYYEEQEEIIVNL